MSWTWTSVLPGSIGYPYGVAKTSAGVFMVGVNASTLTKLWKSVDNGMSFSLVSTDLPTSAFILGPFNSIGTTLVMLDGGAFDGKYYYSTNNGANFTEAFLPSSPGSSILQLVSDGTALYTADFDNRVWRTTNGSSWTEKTGVPGSIGTCYTLYGVNGLLFAGSQSGGKFAVSDDGATTWTVITPPSVSTTHTYAWFAYFNGKYHTRLNKNTVESQYYTSDDGLTWTLETTPPEWTDGGADEQLFHTSLAEGGTDVLLALEWPASDIYTFDEDTWASELGAPAEFGGLWQFDDVFYFASQQPAMYRGTFEVPAGPTAFWTAFNKTTEVVE